MAARGLTLAGLRYTIAVARERHCGRAAAAYFVSQPTPSVAISKRGAALDIKLFEPGIGEVGVTPEGEAILRQAPLVAAEATTSGWPWAPTAPRRSTSARGCSDRRH